MWCRSSSALWEIGLGRSHPQHFTSSAAEIEVKSSNVTLNINRWGDPKICVFLKFRVYICICAYIEYGAQSTGHSKLCTSSVCLLRLIAAVYAVCLTVEKYWLTLSYCVTWGEGAALREFHGNMLTERRQDSRNIPKEETQALRPQSSFYSSLLCACNGWRFVSVPMFMVR